MASEALLEAADLSFSYGRGEDVLSHWSEKFKAGEVVALTGPSGRGKSTLLSILSLLLRPTAGRLIYDGGDVTDISDASRSRLRAHALGFVFQDAALDPTRTVLDNVLETSLYRGDSRQPSVSRARMLLDQFGVEIRASHKPRQISGGQAQRVALCRALLGSPQLLFADEPTGNLDADSTNTVMSAFQLHAQTGALVVVATHDRSVVAQCSREVAL